MALDYVRDGDGFVVTKLDRLARSVGDLLNIVERLEGFCRKAVRWSLKTGQAAKRECSL
jgi:hypothetical protein